MNVSVLGIDLAKTVFHLYGSDKSGKCLAKKKTNRAKLLQTIEALNPQIVFMESCGSSHYWAREVEKLGPKVKLISPQFVKPFLKSNKNDYLDAEAIVEAGTRANMRFVPIKQTWHQDLQLFHRIRERLIRTRTALCNEIRGFLLEYGFEIRVGRAHLTKELPAILENRTGKLSGISRSEISELYDELVVLNQRISDYDKKIKLYASQNEDCVRMQKLRGIGPIIATAIIAATPDPAMFKNGREYAAWLGLVPRQHSSGGKDRLLGISKRGDSYLRKQLIHGCRSTIYRSSDTGDDIQQWAFKLKKRRGNNRATVGLANKNARMLWAVLTKKEDFKFAA